MMEWPNGRVATLDAEDINALHLRIGIISVSPDNKTTTLLIFLLLQGHTLALLARCCTRTDTHALTPERILSLTRNHQPNFCDTEHVVSKQVQFESANAQYIGKHSVANAS
jgi:hypothetical protein